MKKIKEKMTVVSADGKVTFYLEKRSDVCLYDCLHLDVIDDVEELRLDIPGMTTLLLSEEHAFPSVRKIYIGKEIQNIMIYNKTFPNVREVESDSNVFCSGSMLVRNENFGMSKTLLNTFCLKSDETADLNGIADIVGSAFYGCECTKAINTEQVKHMSAYAFRDSAFADAKKNPPVDGLLMAGSIIIAADPQADKYVIPDFATLCNSLKFNLSATLVVENVTVSAHILYLSGKIEEVHMIVLDIDGKQLYMPRTLKLGTEHLVQKILHDKIEDSYGIMFLYANSGRCKLVVAAMSYIAGSRNAKLVKFVKENEKAISNTLLAYGHIKELSEFIQTGFVSHRTLSLMLKALEDGTDTNAALKNNPEASILHDEGKQTTAKAYILKALSEQKNKNNEELHIS